MSELHDDYSRIISTMTLMGRALPILLTSSLQRALPRIVGNETINKI